MSSDRADSSTGSIGRASAQGSPSAENNRTNVDQDIILLRQSIEQDEGDSRIAEIFSRFRHQLERVVDFRMDPRIRPRVDSNDVLQEAFLDIKSRYREFVRAPGVSLFVWFRQVTLQVLIEFQRRHFRQKRDVQKEIRLNLPAIDQSDASQMMARELAGQLTSPSQAAIKAEELERLQQALESMNETDREILALRHFEQLSNSEVAEIIGIKPAAASNRYVRAIAKLGEIMERLEK